MNKEICKMFGVNLRFMHRFFLPSEYICNRFFFKTSESFVPRKNIYKIEGLVKNQKSNDEISKQADQCNATQEDLDIRSDSECVQHERQVPEVNIQDWDNRPPETFASDWKHQLENRRQENRERKSQRAIAYRPDLPPEDTSIILFPGQGSQFVGMAKHLLQFDIVVKMYTRASDILGYDLLDVCLNGPQKNLDMTKYCQPATLVTSLGAIEKLKRENPKAVGNCIGTAGFSVGEIAALVFAGSLEFEDAMEFVKVRSRSMQQASEEADSGMMTVFLNADSKLNKAMAYAKEYLRQKPEFSNNKPVCEVANYLYPGCKVVGGHIKALCFIEENMEEFKISNVKHLPVSGAFHTSLMMSAKKKVEPVLRSITFKEPLIPVYRNVDGRQHENPAAIGRFLARQIVKPVKWEQIMHILYTLEKDGVHPPTVEVGPGRQLGAMLRKVNRKAFTLYQSVAV